MAFKEPFIQSSCVRLWPWLVLFFAATNVIFLGGKRRAFGVFVARLHVEYNSTVSLAELNWIGDSYAAFGYMTTTFSSAAILYFKRQYRIFMFVGSLFVLAACLTSAYVPNPHWLFLTHTLLHGIGSSLILSVVGLIVNEFFDKSHRYHLLATTLVSGGSVASVIFVNFFAFIIQEFNWRNSFIILGVIYFIVEVAAVPFFEKNENLDDYSRKNCCVCIEGYIPPRKYVLLLLWWFDRVMTSVVTYGLLLNLADYVHRKEHSLVKSSFLTTLFAAGEASTYLIGAVLMAITEKFFHNRLRYVLFVTTLAMAILLFLWEAFAHHRTLSRVIAFFSGFCMGPSVTFLFPAGEEFTMTPGHLAYPFSLAGMGFGMAISPLVTATIAEAYSYKYFFFIQGVMISLKAIALLVLILLLRWMAAKYPEDEYEELQTPNSVNGEGDGEGDEADFATMATAPSEEQTILKNLERKSYN